MAAAAKTSPRLSGPEIDEFIGCIRKYEKDSSYVPGFARYETTCGQG